MIFSYIFRLLRALRKRRRRRQGIVAKIAANGERAHSANFAIRAAAMTQLPRLCPNPAAKRGYAGRH
jgi:hypothetical protein